MRQQSLTVNLGYDIMGAGVVGLSSFLITLCAVIRDCSRDQRGGEVMGSLGMGNALPAPGTESAI